MVEVLRGSTHFLLVVNEPARLVIGNSIVVLAHVSQDAQEAFTIGWAGLLVETVPGGKKQRGKQAAVLGHEAVREVALGQPGQLGLRLHDLRDFAMPAVHEIPG